MLNLRSLFFHTALLCIACLCNTAKSQAQNLCFEIFSKPQQEQSLFKIPSFVNDYELKKFLGQKMYPEAARRASALNLRDLAYQIENYILSSLKNDKVVGLPRYLSAGSTEVYLVKLESGIQAIFKPNPEHWVVSSKQSHAYLSNSHAEVAAYQLARVMGIEFVPVTVMREVDGKLGSLQVFVQGSHVTENNFSFETSTGRDLIEQAADLMAFDYLIRNSDRGEKNTLVNYDTLWAIDNGSAFYPTEIRFNRSRLDDVPLSQMSVSFIVSLQALSPGIIRNVLSDYPNKLVVEEIIQRRMLLLQALPENSFSKQ